MPLRQVFPCLLRGLKEKEQGSPRSKVTVGDLHGHFARMEKTLVFSLNKNVHHFLPLLTLEMVWRRKRKRRRRRRKRRRMKRKKRRMMRMKKKAHMYHYSLPDPDMSLVKMAPT